MNTSPPGSSNQAYAAADYPAGEDHTESSVPHPGLENEGIDISAEDYEALRGDGEGQIDIKESKSQEAMRLMLDPSNKESAKSLWRGLFEPSLSSLPKIELLLLKHPEKEEEAYLEWYNQLLMLHRRYLQSAFEDPASLPDLSKRVGNFLCAKRGPKLQWRQDWVSEYMKYRQTAKEVEEEIGEKAKADALKKRKARLEERRRVTAPES